MVIRQDDSEELMPKAFILSGAEALPGSFPVNDNRGHKKSLFSNATFWVIAALAAGLVAFQVLVKS